MRIPRFARVLAGILAVGIAATSCGPERSLTAPPPNPDLIGGVLGTVGNVAGALLQCSALPDYQASKVIGPSGGFLQVGPHLLVIPPGALSSNVTITAHAPSDRTRDIQFGPTGLQFQEPAALSMSYDSCGLLVGLLPKVAYTTDLLSILYYVPSLNDARHHLVVGDIKHFSRYAVAY